MNNGKIALSVTEVAKHLGIGRNLAYEAIQRGEIPSIKVGGRILVPVAALEALLAQVSQRDAQDQQDA